MLKRQAQKITNKENSLTGDIMDISNTNSVFDGLNNLADTIENWIDKQDTNNKDIDSQFIYKIYDKILTIDQCNRIIEFEEETGISIKEISITNCQYTSNRKEFCDIIRIIYGYISDISGYPTSNISKMEISKQGDSHTIIDKDDNILLHIILCLQSQRHLLSTPYIIFKDMKVNFMCDPGTMLVWYNSPITHNKIISEHYQSLYINTVRVI